MFKGSEEKKERGEFAIGSYASETPIHETNKEDINDLLSSGHEVDDDRPPAPKKNPALQEILNDKYIKRDVNGVAYTIGGRPTFDKIQKNLME